MEEEKAAAPESQSLLRSQPVASEATQDLSSRREERGTQWAGAGGG